MESKNHYSNRFHKFGFTILYLYILYFFGLMFAFISKKILPGKYFSDGNLILQLLKQDFKTTNTFDSFVNTAFIYSFFGFTQYTSQSTIIFVTFTFTSLLIFSIYIINRKSNFLESTLLLFFWIFPCSIYLSQYSKELISIVFVFFIVLFSSLKKPFNFLVFVPAIFYAVFFRIYWLLIVGLWLLFWIILRKKYSLVKKVILVSFICLICAYIYYLFTNRHLSDIRTGLNVNRIGFSFAESIIKNYFPTSNIFFDLINWIISFFFILVPLPLLLLFDVRYLFFFLLIFSTTIYFYKLIKVFYRYKDRIKSSLRSQFYCLTSFILAFTMTQAIFEPDYGSVFKHLTNLLPVFSFFFAKNFEQIKDR